MENNWPETVDELLEECQRLIMKHDLYTLGKCGEPYTGDTEPRVDGTEYLAGEYQYGVVMVPAQWVTHVIDAATLGAGECEFVGDAKHPPKCSACGWQTSIYDCEWLEDGYEYDGNFCKQCGRKVKR